MLGGESGSRIAALRSISASAPITSTVSRWSTCSAARSTKPHRRKEDHRRRKRLRAPRLLHTCRSTDRSLARLPQALSAESIAQGRALRGTGDPLRSPASWRSRFSSSFPPRVSLDLCCSPARASSRSVRGRRPRGPAPWPVIPATGAWQATLCGFALLDPRAGDRFPPDPDPDRASTGRRTRRRSSTAWSRTISPASSSWTRTAPSAPRAASCAEQMLDASEDLARPPGGRRVSAGALRGRPLTPLEAAPPWRSAC